MVASILESNNQTVFDSTYAPPPPGVLEEIPASSTSPPQSPVMIIPPPVVVQPNTTTTTGATSAPAAGTADIPPVGVALAESPTEPPHVIKSISPDWSRNDNSKSDWSGFQSPKPFTKSPESVKNTNLSAFTFFKNFKG